MIFAWSRFIDGVSIFFWETKKNWKVFNATLYINKDEVIKEATAFRNVAINCAPYSVANDDFETLAGWLVSRASQNDQ